MTTCISGKAGHLSRYGARRASIGVAIKRTHGRLRVYQCPSCHQWHLTSASGHSRPVARRVHGLLPEPHPASAAEFAVWFAAHQHAHSPVTSAAADRG